MKVRRGTLSIHKHLLEGKTAVINGTSEGVGEAIAELFAEEGANIVLLARGRELLDLASDMGQVVTNQVLQVEDETFL